MKVLSSVLGIASAAVIAASAIVTPTAASAAELGQIRPAAETAAADEVMTLGIGEKITFSKPDNSKPVSYTFTAKDNAVIWLNTTKKSRVEKDSNANWVSATATDSKGNKLESFFKDGEDYQDINSTEFFMTKAGETYTVEVDSCGVIEWELKMEEIQKAKLNEVYYTNRGEFSYSGQSFISFTADKDGLLRIVVDSMSRTEDSADYSFNISESADLSDDNINSGIYQYPVKKGQTYYIRSETMWCYCDFHLSLSDTIKLGDTKHVNVSDTFLFAPDRDVTVKYTSSDLKGNKYGCASMCVYEVNYQPLEEYDATPFEARDFTFYFKAKAGHTYIINNYILIGEDDFSYEGEYDVHLEEIPDSEFPSDVKETESTTVSEPEKKLYGDVNGDGNISVSDATEIQKALTDLSELSGEQLKLADVNGDNRITVRDATCIRKYLANYEKGFGKTGEVFK